MLFHIISTFGHLLDWRSGSYRLVAKLLVHDYISITSMSKCNILTYASTDVSSQDMGTLEHSGRTQERYQPKWSESVHVPSMYIFKYCYMYMHPLLKSIFFDINKTFSRSFKMYTVSQIILVLWVKRLKRAFSLKLNLNHAWNCSRYMMFFHLLAEDTIFLTILQFYMIYLQHGSPY